MRNRLTWSDIDLGDILADFCPARQQTVHYLVVDKKIGKIYCVGHGIQHTSYFILQPIDVDGPDITITWYDLNREFATWRKKG